MKRTVWAKLYGRFNDFGFHRPLTPADQGPCGVDKSSFLLNKMSKIWRVLV